MTHKLQELLQQKRVIINITENILQMTFKKSLLYCSEKWFNSTKMSIENPSSDRTYGLFKVLEW